jgi:hypothetical protein
MLTDCGAATPSRSDSDSTTPVSRPISPSGKLSRSTTCTTCSDQRAERHARPTAARLEREWAERLDDDRLGRDDVERHLARDNIKGLADLTGDVVGDRRGVGDVVEVAAAGGGHLLQQVLVEVGANAEGGRAHATSAQLAAWLVSSSTPVMPTLARPSVSSRRG